MVPTNTEVLMMDPKRLQKVLALKHSVGETAQKAGNNFHSFALKVHSLEQVADTYLQMKYRFADAST